MDTAVFNTVSSACGELLAANGYTCSPAEGRFFNDDNEFSVRYDSERSQFVLAFTDKKAGAAEVELASWLSDGESKGDAAVIGEDFADTVAVKLGLKKPSHSAPTVAMPAKSAAGEQHGIDSLTQKLLSVFPQFKDTYKEHVAELGGYYYVKFMKETFVPKLAEMTAAFDANRKALEKTFKMLADVYYNCDRTAADAICALIIVGAFRKNPAEFEKLAPALENYPYFMTAGREILAQAARSKKLTAVFED